MSIVTPPAKKIALPPSRIAQHVAATRWNQIQSQTMIAKGLYWFSCAGHGGCVAVHGAVDIPEEAWEIARTLNQTTLVARRHSHLYNSERYKRSGLEHMPEQTEVWTGEEDAEWSSIFAAHADLDGLIARANSKGFSFTRERTLRGSEKWYPAVHQALIEAGLLIP